jgi:phosphoglycolate phosphatase-like HAD superfamily hydrolase
LIQALVFDFDGTLVDSDPIKRMAFYDVTVDILGASEVLETIFAMPNPGDRYDIFAMLAAQLKSDSADNWAEAYDKLCQSRILDLLAHSDVEQTLAKLKIDGYRLFIASATPQADLVSLVGKSSLAPYFEGVYGRPTAKNDILRKILSGNTWAPREIAMIGNAESDLQAAEAVGCHFVGMAGNGNDFNSQPEMNLSDLGDLQNIIEHLDTSKPEKSLR